MGKFFFDDNDSVPILIFVDVAVGSSRMFVLNDISFCLFVYLSTCRVPFVSIINLPSYIFQLMKKILFMEVSQILKTEKLLTRTKFLVVQL